MSKELDQEPESCKKCPYLNNISFLEHIVPQRDFLNIKTYIKMGGQYCTIYRQKINNIKEKNCNNINN